MLGIVVHFARSIVIILQLTMIKSYINLFNRSYRQNIHPFASKHIASREKRGVPLETNLVDVPDPKKIALLNKLGLEIDSDDDKSIVTGAELRKNRKVNAAISLKINKSSNKNVKAKSNNVIADRPVRFRLGNGIEALTSKSLVDLVKSTAPYYFPESAPKLVMDDEDEMDLFIDNESPSADIHPNSNLLLDIEGWGPILKHAVDTIPSTETPTVKQRIDYFSLCLASHFSTVATYVPTDVDSKIRGHCWLIRFILFIYCLANLGKIQAKKLLKVNIMH